MKMRERMRMAEGDIRSSGVDTKPYRKYSLQPEWQCATMRLVVWTCNLNCDEGQFRSFSGVVGPDVLTTTSTVADSPY